MPLIRSLRHRRYPFVAPITEKDLCAVGATRAALQVARMSERVARYGAKNVGVRCCYKRVAPMVHKKRGCGAIILPIPVN